MESHADYSDIDVSPICGMSKTKVKSSMVSKPIARKVSDPENWTATARQLVNFLDPFGRLAN